MSQTATQTTPMMKQYLAIKEAHKDYMLFYRMGDFYELFLDDAVKASKILDIVLTKRGKNNGEDIPMCGVPCHSHESYLERLIKAGEKVAICEQVETPEEAKKRGGYKAVVKREVVRIITAGTITEDSLLKNRTNNFLAAISQQAKNLAIACIDISTGEFYTSNTTKENLISDLAKFSISEIIFPQSIFENNDLYPKIKQNYQSFSHHPNHIFGKTKGEERLKKVFNISVLDSFGELSDGELGACGALLEYIDLTQKGKYPHLDIPKRIENSYYMEIDASTRRNLELTRSMNGEYKNSLLSVIDYTITASGSRLFASYLSAPLTDANVINRRLDTVEFFLDEEDVRENTRRKLKEMPDMERAVSRLTLGRGTPNDLFAIRIGLENSGKIKQILQSYKGMSSPDDLILCLNQLGEHSEIIHTLSRAIKFEPTLKDFIEDGYCQELDELRILEKESSHFIKKLQGAYIEETGVSSLKIKYNNILGYYIEVTKNNSDKLSDKFIHRQTMANAMRFKTEKLVELEQKIFEASAKIAQLEQDILRRLIAMVAEKAEDIINTARTIAKIDVTSSLARLAAYNDYVRPVIDNSFKFEVEEGRHPVVEENTENFIANSCYLKKNFWLLTGPNMAGKSTFLRQNALIAIMAQMGAYVPAKSAHIGVIDKVFSRVGASDDLASGRSTFMVEMVETAAILNQATKRSFVILDEIGRGTATFDGLSIAWATIEHLHDNNKCRTLFATHYHELTDLSDKLLNFHCVTMQVKEWKDEIIFLHKVVGGAADRSYGIHVAQLAGIPKPVIVRANEILHILEATERQKIPETMPLFNNAPNIPSAPLAETEPSIFEQKLDKINVDELSPREALELIYELKKGKTSA